MITVEIQKHHKQTIVSFTYDPFGRRIEKSVTGTSSPRWGEDRGEGEWFDRDDHGDKDDHHATRTTYYVYDNQDILLEYDQHGRVESRYVHGLGIDEHLAVEKRDDVYYYHADGLGSITVLTDKKQHVVQTYRYDSFGNIIREHERITQLYTFTGREWDEEIGLYYYRARYYDPKTGRFNLQKDPIGIRGGINLYAYVGNNPVNFKDPYGLYELTDTAGDPVDMRTHYAIRRMEQCLRGKIKAIEPRVTGARECGDPHVPDSAHCSGQACDLGRNSNPGLNDNDVADCFNQCIGPDCFIWGYAGQPNVHLQTRPGLNNSTGFRGR